MSFEYDCWRCLLWQVVRSSVHTLCTVHGIVIHLVFAAIAVWYMQSLLLCATLVAEHVDISSELHIVRDTMIHDPAIICFAPRVALIIPCNIIAIGAAASAPIILPAHDPPYIY